MLKIINLTILECKLKRNDLMIYSEPNNKSNHIGM